MRICIKRMQIRITARKNIYCLQTNLNILEYEEPVLIVILLLPLVSEQGHHDLLTSNIFAKQIITPQTVPVLNLSHQTDNVATTTKAQFFEALVQTLVFTSFVEYKTVIVTVGSSLCITSIM
jgi:hypothetical protein